jgi:hypothetical protein
MIWKKLTIIISLELEDMKHKADIATIVGISDNVRVKITE